MHVPLGLRWPGHIAPGSSESPVQLVDLMPTLLELAGLALAEPRDGQSRVPLLRGAAIRARPAFSELRTGPSGCSFYAPKPDCELDRVAVQTERFKLTSSPESERLYDLKSDPAEVHDVSAEYPEEAARLRKLIDVYRATPSPLGKPPTPTEKELSDETRQQLRSLGYIE